MDESEPFFNTDDLWKPLLGVFGAYLLDALILGQGGLAIAMGLIGLLYFLPSALYKKMVKKKANEGKLLLTKGIILILAATGVLLTNKINNSIAFKNGQRLVSACERFKEATGTYPDDLSVLVPEYISKIPRAKLVVFYGDFEYSGVPRRHVLSWMVFPPYGRRAYSFEQAAWTSGE